MLEKLKDKLKITWSDEDQLLSEILAQGEYYLNSITAENLNYNSNKLAESLLLEYSRYSYNNALEYFEENFKGQLLKLQIEVAINAKN